MPGAIFVVARRSLVIGYCSRMGRVFGKVQLQGTSLQWNTFTTEFPLWSRMVYLQIFFTCLDKNIFKNVICSKLELLDELAAYVGKMKLKLC